LSAALSVFAERSVPVRKMHEAVSLIGLDFFVCHLQIMNRDQHKNCEILAQNVKNGSKNRSLNPKIWVAENR